MLDRADIVTATGHQYTKSCMFARNRYLVDNADMLLAAYDGQPGGTEMTIRYAEAGAEIPGELPQTVSDPRPGKITDYHERSGQTHQPEPELYQKIAP
ncbi:MAG: hypothetical protein IJI21_07830 [Clostridia bacterium]|nr:hypothetical protein [Clostridia bacterium]